MLLPSYELLVPSKVAYKKRPGQIQFIRQTTMQTDKRTELVVNRVPRRNFDTQVTH